jgi:hypothetical protein
MEPADTVFDGRPCSAQDQVVRFLAFVVGLGICSSAAAQDATLLRSLRDLQDACTDSQGTGPRELFAVDVESRSWSFGAWEEGVLPIASQRNLRAYRGAAELFSAGFETFGFVTNRGRARELQRARQRGATLRVGFFLGFDNPYRTLCLVRPAAGVTTVRMDIAFVELSDAEGRVIAREDTERMRAWLDDQDTSTLPGRGPRGAVGRPLVHAGRSDVPDAWARAYERAGQGDLGTTIARCHAAGVARGANDEGDVVVRLTVDARSGAVVEHAVELADIGDAEEAECIERAVAGVRLSPDSAGGTVLLSVPVQLAN